MTKIPVKVSKVETKVKTNTATNSPAIVSFITFISNFICLIFLEVDHFFFLLGCEKSEKMLVTQYRHAMSHAMTKTSCVDTVNS